MHYSLLRSTALWLLIGRSSLEMAMFQKETLSSQKREPKRSDGNRHIKTWTDRLHLSSIWFEAKCLVWLDWMLASVGQGQVKGILNVFEKNINFGRSYKLCIIHAQRDVDKCVFHCIIFYFTKAALNSANGKCLISNSYQLDCTTPCFGHTF